MSIKTIAINPITRLEGHNKIEIFLNEAHEVIAAYKNDKLQELTEGCHHAQHR